MKMDYANWFALWVDLSAMARNWNDWSEDGLFRYFIVVRSAVQMNLFLESNFPGGGRRWTTEKRIWAVRWLSDPDGKAVPHV